MTEQPSRPNMATVRDFAWISYHYLHSNESIRKWEAIREWQSEIAKKGYVAVDSEDEMIFEFEKETSPIGGWDYRCTTIGRVAERVW